MEKCTVCGKEFKTEFEGFFASPICPECDAKKRENAKKEAEEARKEIEKHPDWYGPTKDLF